MRERLPGGREGLALGAIVAAAGLLRFATLDVQGFWFDEAVTVGLLDRGFGDMLGEIPDSESTPPLYYVVAWLWTRVFGLGEVGLRSLSALLGTAAVPVAWAAARELAGRRAALWTAGLAAVAPILVWYSQEARAYALLVLLGALSLWLLARLIRTRHTRDAALWATVCALALATHYFAVFLVVAEAAWVMAVLPRRRALAAVGAVGAAGLALLPLALAQERAGLASYIAEEPLAERTAKAVKQLVLGFDSPLEPLTAGLAAALAAAGVALVLWSRRPRARGVIVAASVGGFAVLAPLLAALAGADYVLSRNLLGAWVPLTIAAVAGWSARRTGRAGQIALAALAALCAVSALGVPLTRAWQREDWRGAAEAVGAPAARAVVVGEASHAVPLRLYRPGARPARGGRHRVSEVVAIARRGRDLEGVPASPPDPAALERLGGLRVVQRRREPTWELVRMRPRGGTVTLSRGELRMLRVATGNPSAAVLLERP